MKGWNSPIFVGSQTQELCAKRWPIERMNKSYSRTKSMCNKSYREFSSCTHHRDRARMCDVGTVHAVADDTLPLSVRRVPPFIWLSNMSRFLRLNATTRAIWTLNTHRYDSNAKINNRFEFENWFYYYYCVSPTNALIVLRSDTPHSSNSHCNCNDSSGCGQTNSAKEKKQTNDKQHPNN